MPEVTPYSYTVVSENKPWIHIKCPNGSLKDARVFIRRAGEEPGTYVDEEIPYFTKVTWELDAKDGFAKATLWAMDVSVDVVGEAQINVINPKTGMTKIDEAFPMERES